VAKPRSLARPIGVKPVRVQEAFQHNLRVPALDRERWTVAHKQVLRELRTVAASQALRRWKAGEDRVPSKAWRKEVMRRWTVIVVRQAAKTCPPHNPCRAVPAAVPVAVPAVGPLAAVPAVAAVPAAAVPGAVAAAEEDKKERICVHTDIIKKRGY